MKSSSQYEGAGNHSKQSYKKILKAILLAAGYGKRLHPLTEYTPKCLVPINGVPLLEIWLSRLSEVGVEEFLVNTHYLQDQVSNFLENSLFKKNVKIVFESKLQGTAGTLRNNIDFFDGQDGFLIHADNYCLADFNAFIQAHQNRPLCCDITMMTFSTDTPETCGIVELDDDNIVTAFHEKVSSPPGNLANGAVYILAKEFMHDFINNFDEASDLSTEVLHQYMGRIYAYHTDAIFMDIGTPEAYARANSLE